LCCGVMLKCMKRLLCATTAIFLCATAVAQDNGYWKATSNTARSVTGDIAISHERLSIYFQPFTIADLRELAPEEITAVFNFDTPDGVQGKLYRLSIAADRKFLHKNTICGAEETQYMATAVQGKTMQVAFFSGSKMPSLKAEDLNNSTNLCGTYMYSR